MSTNDARLQRLVDLVLRMAGGEHSARVEPSEAADMIDAVTVGINLLAESLDLERRRRERAEALLGDAMIAYDEAPAMFCSVASETYEILKCNSTLARALGMSKEHLLQRRLLGFVPARDRADATLALRAIQEGRCPERTGFSVVSERGETPILLSGTVADPDTGRLSLVLRDVSIEAELEERLRRAQQLELMGRLGSSVAHDFNNVLAVIKAGASLLQVRVDDDVIPEILNAVDVGAGLTRQLLDLGRPPTEEPPTQVDLNGLVGESQ